jgi:5-deoxy-5-amino-3-dehydroquinate synthase
VRIEVALWTRTYDVHVGAGARNDLATLLRVRAPQAKSVAIITSEALLNMPWFEIESDLDQTVLLVPEGESAKNLLSVEVLLNELAERRFSRDDVIVAVGGGAITDLAGFVAAIYLRGIGVIHVPTTLVGQVDAAIGGKTGVNLSLGKNLVGAFHQPIGVLCDSDMLATLSERERLSGLGEIAKCWLLENRDAGALSEMSMSDLIELSIRLKANIVGADEYEGGLRANLNYGHTLAHALEKLALARDVDELRHGEAVAIGLAFAVRLALELELVDESVVANHDAVLDALGLARRLHPKDSIDEIVEAMGHDKKAHHDLSFVLPSEEGFKTVRGVDPDVVRNVLERFRGEL